MRLLVVNPNISAFATERIGRMACRAASAGTRVTTVSAPSGVALIQTDEQSERAAPAVVALLAARQDTFDAAVIAAFTDSGLEAARMVISKPVVGIAEAAMLEAASAGRRFAIVTLGATLIELLQRLAARYGVADRLAAVEIVAAPFVDVASDPDRHRELLVGACRDLIDTKGVDAIVLGAGPLAGMAGKIAGEVDVPLFDPIVCAVRRAEGLADRTDKDFATGGTRR